MGVMTLSLSTKPLGLVDRDCVQKGIDFIEIYSSMVSQSAFNILFAIAASNNCELVTFDVKTAFLYGEINDDTCIYVHP